MSSNDRISLIEGLLVKYVETYSNQFIQCSSVRLAGVEQVLSALVRKKRDFRLFADSEWTVIWEVIESTDFADPAVAHFLSAEADVETIWVKPDDDYNIWAFQVFRNGTSTSEAFLPTSYFSGDTDSAERFRYGSCWEHAEAFNSSRDLPLFLSTLPTLERYRVRKLACKLPSATG
jgi:hypothetical protein